MGRLLHLGSTGRRLVAALWAYLDESGVGDEGMEIPSGGLVFSVGGFIGMSDDWEAFTKKWLSVLLANGFATPPVFHMTDFLRDTANDPVRRERVLALLIEVITKSPLLGSGCVLMRGHPQSWAQIASGKIMKTGYIATGYVHCIDSLAHRASSFLGADEQIAFVCGAHQKQGHLVDIYEAAKVELDNPVRHRLGPIAFGSPAEFIPLQASDLLAYETRRRASRAPGSVKRRSLLRLEKSGMIEFRMATEEIVERGIKQVIADPAYPEKASKLDRLKRKRQRMESRRRR
jgi:hypothetical protein